MRKITTLEVAPAPGELAILQGFLNTANFEAGTDDLATPKALATWLAAHGFAPPGTELDEADVRRACDVREGWREILRSGQLTDARADRLNRGLASVRLQAMHEADGTLHLQPASKGLDAALGRLLAVVAYAQSHPDGSRLKVCASATCRAVFFDGSTNRAGKWCHPRCGNRPIARRTQKQHRAHLAAIERRRQRALFDRVERQRRAEAEGVGS